MRKTLSISSMLLAGVLVLSSCTTGGDHKGSKPEETKPPAPVPTLDLPKNVSGDKVKKWNFDAKFNVSVEEGTLNEVNVYPLAKAEKRKKAEAKKAEESEESTSSPTDPSTESTENPSSSPQPSETEEAQAGSETVTPMPSMSPYGEPSENPSSTPSSSPTDAVDEEEFETDEDPSEGIDDKFFLDGKMSEDETSWKRDKKKELKPDTKYRWVVSTTDDDGKERFYSGDIRTRKFKDSEKAGFRSNIGDGQTVGVAAPIIITFNTKVKSEYRAGVEKNLSVKVKGKKVKGSWGWLSDDAEGSRLHYRTKDYWPSKSKVSADVDLKNVKLGDDVWSTQKMSLDFKIGRKQEVVANAQTHRMTVTREGKTIMSFPASLGSKKSPSYNGTHVVMSKHRNYTMTSARWGYSTPVEYAVRIHNNGEFIHAAPWSVGSQGSSNVSHGCVNLSTPGAKQYYDSAMYGDPVEVKGSSVTLSKNASDISDWAYSWKEWKSLSALGK